MYVGTELSEEDINKLEAIKDHLSGGGKLKISNSAAIRYLIREYGIITVKGKIHDKDLVLVPDKPELFRNLLDKHYPPINPDSAD